MNAYPIIRSFRRRSDDEVDAMIRAAAVLELNHIYYTGGDHPALYVYDDQTQLFARRGHVIERDGELVPHIEGVPI